MVKQIYPSELQLNKANSSDTEALFLDLHLTISDGFVLSKLMINGMSFLDIVNFPLLRWGYSSRCILRGLYSTAYSIC